MLQLMKRRFRQMLKGEPGARFRNLYHLRHEKTESSPWRNRLYAAAGISFILGGLILSILPGIPGFLVTFLGISMIVARSYLVATFFDAIEMSVRCVLGKGCPSS